LSVAKAKAVRFVVKLETIAATDKVGGFIEPALPSVFDSLALQISPTQKLAGHLYRTLFPACPPPQKQNRGSAVALPLRKFRDRQAN